MALDKEIIQAGLAKAKHLEANGGAVEEMDYKKGINNHIDNFINQKMMNGEELSEDDINVINEVSNTFGVDMDRYIGDYLNAMEEQGYDTSKIQQVAIDMNAKVAQPTQSNTASEIDFTNEEKEFIEYIADQQGRSYEDIEEMAVKHNKEFKKEFKDFMKKQKKQKKRKKQQQIQQQQPKKQTTYEDREIKQKARIRRMRPEDLIEQLSGAEIGSPEYMATKEALDELKKINSTKKINRNLKWLGYFGVIGMVVSLFIGVLGFQFDVNYHMPKLEAIIGDLGVWIFSGFGALLIMALLHIPMDALVNRRYREVSRNLLLVLLVAGAGLKIYIDSRVTDLYAKKVAEEKRVAELSNSTKLVGSEYTNIKKAKERQEKQVDKIDKDIDFYREKLKKNEENPRRKEIEAFIAKFSVMSKTQWRTKHLKENRKILEKLDRDKISIENHIELLEKKKEKYLSVATQNTNKLNQLLEKTQDGAKQEATNRKYMLWAILLLIELASLLKIYAEFIRNKNTPVELDALNKVNTFLDAGETINAVGFQLAETLNRANQVRGNQVRDFIEYGAYSNLQNEQHAIANAHKLGDLMRKNTDTTMELVQDMIEGKIYQLQAQRAERKVQLLEDKFKKEQ